MISIYVDFGSGYYNADNGILIPRRDGLNNIFYFTGYAVPNNGYYTNVVLSTVGFNLNDGRVSPIKLATGLHYRDDVYWADISYGNSISLPNLGTRYDNQSGSRAHFVGTYVHGSNVCNGAIHVATFNLSYRSNS